VFSGTYNDDLNLKGHQIDVVYMYDDGNIKEGRIDAETDRHAKEFLKKTKLPTHRPDGLTNLLIVVYRFDLDTGVRAYKETMYIVTQ
jgi:hypothetical protein